MPTYLHHVADQAGLEAACEWAAAARMAQLPIFRGAADGRHALALMNDPAALWPRRINRCTGPALALIGDDQWPAAASLGPAGWVCARAAKRWAASVIVHGAGPALDHYRLASAAAVLHRRLVLVETDSAHAAEWAAFFDCPVLRFIPPPGLVHPSPVPETMQ